MQIRTVALASLLGMLATSAGALAIPVENKGGTSASVVKDEPSLDAAQTDLAHFSAGQTLNIDARLGHAGLEPAAGGSSTFLFASVTGTDSASSAPPMNLAIVIDRSGSMKGARLANAIAAAVGTVQRMRDGDTVSVVTFDTQAQVVVPPTPTTAGTRPGIEAAIANIRLGGDTCISCGLEAAMTALMPGGATSISALNGGVSRMLLLSDGATNNGIKDVPGLRALAARMRDRGCTISTVGVDVDFDEKVMSVLAQESNGRHHFVANPADLPGVFAQEFDNLLASVARDSELELDLAPGVQVEQVFDRSFRREGGRILVPFGTFSAKEEKTVLVKLRVPADHDGVQPVASLKLVYRDLVQKMDNRTEGHLALRVAPGAATALDPFVETRLQRSKTAQTLSEANDLFLAGRVGDAREKLARQQQELRATATTAQAAAKSAPRPRRIGIDTASPFDVDRDFQRQIAAVSRAEDAFGSGAGRAAGGAPANAAPAAAPLPASREGKAGVRSNQEQINQMGF